MSGDCGPLDSRQEGASRVSGANPSSRGPWDRAEGRPTVWREDRPGRPNSSAVAAVVVVEATSHTGVCQHEWEVPPFTR